MRATRELPARLVLPGHGDPILDHAALIDERLRMHRRRAERMHEILEPGPLSAYEIAVQMWGNVAVTQAYLTLSEVLGHLDLLVADRRRGRATRRMALRCSRPCKLGRRSPVQHPRTKNADYQRTWSATRDTGADA